jgi:hypothetical protein
MHVAIMGRKKCVKNAGVETFWNTSISKAVKKLRE